MSGGTPLIPTSGDASSTTVPSATSGTAGSPPPAPTSTLTGSATPSLIPTSTPATSGAPAPSSSPAGTPGLPSTTSAPVSTSPVLAGVSPGELTSTQLHDILSAGSPLMDQAQGQAAQAAAARGEQNSSLGAQAGESALISSALPIAEQNANAIATRTSQNLQTENNFNLQAAGVAGQEELATQSGEIQSKLSAQGYQQSSELQTQQAQEQLTQLSQQGAQALQQIQAQTGGQIQLSDVNAAHQAVLDNLQAGNTLTLDNQQFQHQQALTVQQYADSLGLSAAQSQEQINQLNVQNQNTLQQIAAQTKATLAGYSAQLGGQYLAAVSNRMNQASQEISGIYSTQGLSSAQQQSAVQNAYSRMQTDLNSIGAFYSQSPQWNPGWGSNGSPSAPVPGGGTTPTNYPTVYPNYGHEPTVSPGPGGVPTYSTPFVNPPPPMPPGMGRPGYTRPNSPGGPAYTRFS